MTWSGRLYNLFITDEAVTPKMKQGGPTLPPLDRKDATQIQGRIVDEKDGGLNEISVAMEGLKQIGLCIGEAIDSQNCDLARINEKSQIVHDDTLAVTLKAAQLTTRNKSSSISKIGVFSFKEITSNQYVSVDEIGNIVLLPTANRSSYFECYCKEENIFAFRNCKTLKYLGTTWLGYVKCLGDRFGKQEECHASDLQDEKVTSLFFLGINFGSGGWLKKVRNADTGEESPWPLSTVTSGIGDREGAASFVVSKVDTAPSADDT